MTFFDRASHVDASNSIFNDVGHNQTNIISGYNVYVNLVSATNRRPGVGPPLQGLHSEMSSREIVLRPTFRSTDCSVRHIAARLIVEIVQSLMASNTSDQFHDLKEELGALQQTLDLTALAIDAHQCTPLGRILANSIGKETEQCIGVLRELLSTIRAYRRGLRSTPIIFPWSRASGSGCESGERRIWQQKLTASQKSLGECLQVLDSYVLISFHF